MVIDCRKCNEPEEVGVRGRISFKPGVLARQWDTARGAIQAEPGWPPKAPVTRTRPARPQYVTTRLPVINAFGSQARGARQVSKPSIGYAYEDMTKRNKETGLLCGEGSAKSIPFGIRRENPTGALATLVAGGERLEHAIIRSIGQPLCPSIWAEGKAIEGAFAEIQWFSDAMLTQMAESVTASQPEARDSNVANT